MEAAKYGRISIIFGPKTPLLNGRVHGPTLYPYLERIYTGSNACQSLAQSKCMIMGYPLGVKQDSRGHAQVVCMGQEVKVCCINRCVL